MIRSEKIKTMATETKNYTGLRLFNSVLSIIFSINLMLIWQQCKRILSTLRYYQHNANDHKEKANKQWHIRCNTKINLKRLCFIHVKLQKIHLQTVSKIMRESLTSKQNYRSILFKILSHKVKFPYLKNITLQETNSTDSSRTVPN